jgi:hypothetical protein
MSPESVFLAWLIALPERSDPSVAAQAMLEDLLRRGAPSAEAARLAELLRQVTPFALAERRRRDGPRRRSAAPFADLPQAAPH